jgi:hypothetical protein
MLASAKKGSKLAGYRSDRWARQGKAWHCSLCTVSHPPKSLATAGSWKRIATHKYVLQPQAPNPYQWVALPGESAKVLPNVLP